MTIANEKRPIFGRSPVWRLEKLVCLSSRNAKFLINDLLSGMERISLVELRRSLKQTLLMELLSLNDTQKQKRCRIRYEARLFARNLI